jgi:hypothetical protein
MARKTKASDEYHGLSDAFVSKRRKAVSDECTDMLVESVNISLESVSRMPEIPAGSDNLDAFFNFMRRNLTGEHDKRKCLSYLETLRLDPCDKTYAEIAIDRWISVGLFSDSLSRSTSNLPVPAMHEGTNLMLIQSVFSRF